MTAIPHEIGRLRKSVDDYHKQLGQALIFKHKWTEEDVDAGLAQRCPYCEDAAYGQGSQKDPYCFGTGYLGGFQNGVTSFMTLGDAGVDVFKLSDKGVLIRDTHPICTAPWNPKIQDGDLLITADWDEAYLTPTLKDRYVCKEVTPVQPRGVYRGVSKTERRPDYVVSQNFQIDRIESWHPYYSVPITFNTSGLPPAPNPGPGQDPDSYNIGKEYELTADFFVAVTTPGQHQSWTF